MIFLTLSQKPGKTLFIFCPVFPYFILSLSTRLAKPLMFKLNYKRVWRTRLTIPGNPRRLCLPKCDSLLTIIPRARGEWALSQYPLRPKAEWAIDSEAMGARGIIVLVKSN